MSDRNHSQPEHNPVPVNRVDQATSMLLVDSRMPDLLHRMSPGLVETGGVHT